MKTGIYQYDVVEVLWDDAEAQVGWEEPPTKINEALVMTVGFLIKETKKHVVVSHTTDNAQINGRIQIPKGMIKSVKVIRSKTGLASSS